MAKYGMAYHNLPRVENSEYFHLAQLSIVEHLLLHVTDGLKVIDLGVLKD
jgi:hypothetical protein